MTNIKHFSIIILIVNHIRIAKSQQVYYQSTVSVSVASQNCKYSFNSSYFINIQLSISLDELGSALRSSTNL